MVENSRSNARRSDSSTRARDPLQRELAAAEQPVASDVHVAGRAPTQQPNQLVAFEHRSGRYQMAHSCTIRHIWHVLAHLGPRRFIRHFSNLAVRIRLGARRARALQPVWAKPKRVHSAGSLRSARCRARLAARRPSRPRRSRASISATWSKPRVSSTSSTAVMPGSVRAAETVVMHLQHVGVQARGGREQRRERAGDIGHLHPHAHASGRT